MVCLSSFPCPNIFSLYTSLWLYLRALTSEKVDHLVSKESLYSGAIGIPPASTARSIICLFAG